MPEELEEGGEMTVWEKTGKLREVHLWVSAVGEETT